MWQPKSFDATFWRTKCDNACHWERLHSIPDLRRRAVFVDLSWNKNASRTTNFIELLDDVTPLALRPDILVALWALAPRAPRNPCLQLGFANAEHSADACNSYERDAKESDGRAAIRNLK